MKPVILSLLGALWPGNEATGPNLSFRAMAETLGDASDFRVVARDRPFGASEPVVESGVWRDLGYAQSAYLPVGRTGAKGLASLIRDTPHDLLMLNGFFDREFTIPALLARRLGRIARKPTILSPRGEFSGGALGLKSGRKSLYRKLVAAGGLLDGVLLHATSEAEEADLRAALPGRDMRRITNFRPMPPLPAFVPRADTAPLRVAFVGRISPVKGLDFALESLARAKSPIDFDIYGPVSDAEHWRRCEALIATLPAHVTATHRGEIANSAVTSTLAARDIMFMPSLSENFGHAIFESLAAGTPVLIGDKTPWRGLESAHAGFDLPLGDPHRFAAALDRMGAMEAGERGAWRRGARAFAEGYVAASTAAAEMRALLNGMMGR